MKIPVLLRTANSLLAFAEARTPDCSDFAQTELVVKRSQDGGKTWSPLQPLVRPETLLDARGLCGHNLVIGNAAPVQLSSHDRQHPNRILVPHTRNNFAVWLTHSDDDGRTWSQPREISGVVKTDSAPDCNRSMEYFGVNLTNKSSLLEWVHELGWDTADPYKRWADKLTGPWQFIGLGPPGSIQLQTGRVLVPGYHSFIRGLSSTSGSGAGVTLPISQLYNNLALGHLIISDDSGDTWRLVSEEGFGGGKGSGANEDQLVELRNGSVLVNSRSFSTGSAQFRVQARSDDGGETFTPTGFVRELPEPFNGCQGSLVVDKADGSLYFSHPNSKANKALVQDILKALGAKVNLTGRDHLSLWTSSDEGNSFQLKSLVDPGASGYSSLQVTPNSSLYILYEQSDDSPFNAEQIGIDTLIGKLTVLNPDRLVFREIRP